MKERFTILDCFRGIAALFVCVEHMHFLNGFSQSHFFRGAGSMSVPFFFTLSGFVISYTYNHLDFRFKNFFISRVFRIFPLHIFTAFVVLLMEILHGVINLTGLHEYEVFGEHKRVSDILPNLLLIHGLTTLTDMFSINAVSWSISDEFYTYLVFGSICLYAGGMRLRLALFLFLLVCGIYGHYGSLFVFDKEFMFCIVCFFIGCMTFSLYRFLKYYLHAFISFELPRPTGGTLGAAMLRMILQHPTFALVSMEILALLVAYVSIDCHIRSLSFVPFSFVILVFALTSHIHGVGHFISRFRPFEYLGKISYSIYLCHMILLNIIITFTGIVDKLFHTSLRTGQGGIHGDQVRFFDFGSYALDSLMTVVFLCVFILFSHYSYHIIEVRGQQLGRRMIGRFCSN